MTTHHALDRTLAMSVYAHILVPIDGSETSACALDEACRGWRRLALGNDSESVVRKAPAPVLLAREKIVSENSGDATFARADDCRTFAPVVVRGQQEFRGCRRPTASVMQAMLDSMRRRWH